MSNYTSLQDIMLVLFGVAVFVIVFSTVRRTLKSTPLFQGKTATMIALAVSALCLVGIYEFLVVPGDLSSSTETGNNTNVILNYILLPYVCLAIAILLSQLLLFASKILPSEESETIAKKTEPKLTKPKPPRRPKKAKPAEKQSKDMTKTAGSPSRKENEKALAN